MCRVSSHLLPDSLADSSLGRLCFQQDCTHLYQTWPRDGAREESIKCWCRCGFKWHIQDFWQIILVIGPHPSLLYFFWGDKCTFVLGQGLLSAVLALKAVPCIHKERPWNDSGVKYFSYIDSMCFNTVRNVRLSRSRRCVSAAHRTDAILLIWFVTISLHRCLPVSCMCIKLIWTSCSQVKRLTRYLFFVCSRWRITICRCIVMRTASA